MSASTQKKRKRRGCASGKKRRKSATGERISAPNAIRNAAIFPTTTASSAQASKVRVTTASPRTTSSTGSSNLASAGASPRSDEGGGGMAETLCAPSILGERVPTLSATPDIAAAGLVSGSCVDGDSEPTTCSEVEARDKRVSTASTSSPRRGHSLCR